MAKGISIDGIDSLNHILEAIGPREARNLNTATIHGIASDIAKSAKNNAPKGDSGVLKKAIKARRRRARNPDKPFSDVMVEHGKSAKNDAWYWHFIEYGTVKKEARPFIQPAVDEVLPQIEQVYKKVFFKKFASRIKREQKKTRRG